MSEASTTTPETDREYPPLWKNWDFVRFFSGRFITNAGDSLYSIAILWLVFELSGSTALTGLASSLLLLPFLLQVIAGPIVDRFRIKPLLVGVQLAQGLTVLVIPVAAYTGNLTVPLLILTVPVLALMNLLIAPVQTALVPRLVDDSQLSQSNSALSTVTYGMDMVFEALGGVFIALFGATSLFLLDSVTFAAAAVLFFGMRVPTVDGGETTGESAVRTYVADLRAGIEALRGTIFVEMLFLSAVANFAVGVTLAILPAFGDGLGGPAVYGLLLGALGTGRMVGSAVASGLRRVPYGRLVAVMYLLSGFLWIGSVIISSVVLTVFLFGLAWIAGGVDTVLTGTLNQRAFPEELLGRISAIKGTAATATLPIGSLLGGLVAGQLGVVATMTLAGLGFGSVGIAFSVRSSLRRLPPVADADPSHFNVDLERSSTETESGEE